ncbi:MAG TPA: SIMPL domain-containing protein [Acidimicrobiales bacterium]|jgi:hypothetical protein|nr:SIMPL domain-containing protein [Acidimicrobiales bacterium]
MSATNETTEQTRAAAAPEGTSPPRRHTGSPVAWLAAVVAILVVVIVAVAGVAFGRSSKSSPATITVTGSGTVQGTPDTVSFTVGVHTTRASAALALEANNTRVQALENTLEAYGVTSKDLQTSNLNIYDQTNQYGTITGFSVDDTLNVTVMNADGTSRGISAKAGRIIDAAAKATGNGIDFGGVSFSISNESNYLAIARARAVQNARTEASQVAKGASTSVTGIVRITDQESSSPPQPAYPFAYLNATASRGVPIQVGRQPVNVQVTVVYTLS